MYIEFLDIIISAVIFSGMGQGKDSGKLLFRKIFSDGSINITEDETSLTFSSSGGGGAVKLDRVAIGTGTGIKESFIYTNLGNYSLTNVRSLRGSYDLTRASYNTGAHSFIISGSTNSITGGYYSTIVGGQTNSIFTGGNDLIVGGSLNQVTGFKQYSGNKIFGGYYNEIQAYSLYGEIFGGKLNRIRNSIDTMFGNKILGGQQNEVQYASKGSVILGGCKNLVYSYVGPTVNCSKSNLILSSYKSGSYIKGSNYPLSPPPGPPPEFKSVCESRYNNIIGSRQSVISSLFSTIYCAPRFDNIIGGYKNKMGGLFSNILSGNKNYVIGNVNSSKQDNFSFMQIISSEGSKICGSYYANIISSYNSYLDETPDKIYSRNVVSSFLSRGTRGGNLFSTAGITSRNGFGLASVGGKFCGGAQVISSYLQTDPDTATASTSMIISSQLDFFGETFGVNGSSTQTFCPGATINVYPHKNSLILSSSLVMNYNTFNIGVIFAGNADKTTIISSNKILSGYNLPGYCPNFSPNGLTFDNEKGDPITLSDNTLMISNYCSCQRSNNNSLMISTIDSCMSNGLFNSIIGGTKNQISSFGPAFYDAFNFNASGDNDGRILRAINGGEVEGIDLGLSRHNIILGGCHNAFYSICGNYLQIGTAGPGLLSGISPGNRSMNTRFSSIIGGYCNRIYADIGTATPTGKNKGVVCNPILNSTILGSYCKDMRVSNRTGVDNLIITGQVCPGSISLGVISESVTAITGTFSNPTSITVCRGFVTAVTT